MWIVFVFVWWIVECRKHGRLPTPLLQLPFVRKMFLCKPAKEITHANVPYEGNLKKKWPIYQKSQNKTHKMAQKVVCPFPSSCVVGYHKLLAFVKVKLSQESAKSAKVQTR